MASLAFYFLARPNTVGDLAPLGHTLRGAVRAPPHLGGALQIEQGLAGSVGAAPMLGADLMVVEGQTLEGIVRAAPALGADLSVGRNLAGVVRAAPALAGNLHIAPPVAEGHTYRYWRMYVTATGGGLGVDGTEMEFIVNGVDQTTPAGAVTAAAASSAFGALLPRNMFDNNTTTQFATDFSGNWPQWISYDFGIPTRIEEFSFKVNNAANRGPRDFQIQGSDDNAAWTTVGSFVGATWASATQRRVFYIQDRPAAVDVESPYRYWRMYVMATGGGVGVDGREMEFLVGGVDQTTPAGAAAAAAASSKWQTQSPASLFDNNTSTTFATDFSNTWPQWISYDFGASPIRLEAVSFHVNSSSDRGPRDFLIQGSNDNANWVTHKYIHDINWTGNTFQTFSIR